MTNHFSGREALAHQFVTVSLHQSTQLNPVGLDDASHRRYFRVRDDNGQSYILMDAPPALEDAGRFVMMARLLTDCLQPVPAIIDTDSHNGFVLMQDFGDVWLNKKLSQSPYLAMSKALNLLSNWQRQTKSIQSNLTDYSRRKLLSEMALFQQWFLPFIDEKFNSVNTIKAISREQQALVEYLLIQPKVCVHRDFHSRNLMWLADYNAIDADIGIIDFQDAFWGPASYDLVSLTRDCYIEYKQSDVCRWEEQFGAQNFAEIDSETWLAYCEHTALQRHLKVLGLFVRLSKNAGKIRYLHDLPLVLNYALKEAVQISQTTCALPVMVESLTLAHHLLPAKIKGQ